MSDLGVREIPIGKGAIFQPGFGPALLTLCFAVALLFLSASRPRKNKGAWPSPGHSSSSPGSSQSTPSLSPSSSPGSQYQS